MTIKKFFRGTLGATIILFASCSKDGYLKNNANGELQSAKVPLAVAAMKKAEVFKSYGDSTSTAEGLSTFRSALGAVLNTAPGAIGGRREVNWDGVPAALTNNDDFPGNFFAAADPALPNGRKRGITFLNSLNGFLISDNDFAFIDESYADEFESFSRKKLFMSNYSNFTEVQFKVPGTNTKAYVEGFGVIFTDVETGNAANIELFDENNESLGVYMAHPQTGKGKFSFIGVKIPGYKISKVVIKSGEVPLGDKDISAGGMYDLVVMDDFLYDEPKELK
jgi:hypothetical protein